MGKAEGLRRGLRELKEWERLVHDGATRLCKQKGSMARDFCV